MDPPKTTQKMDLIDKFSLIWPLLKGVMTIFSKYKKNQVFLAGFFPDLHKIFKWLWNFSFLDIGVDFLYIYCEYMYV